MSYITVPAHFDGEQIQFDDPYPLAPDTPLLITILAPPVRDPEAAAWETWALRGLTAAFGAEEPDYALTMLRERNPAYA